MQEVQRLLAAGASADSVDAEGCPALVHACRAQNADIVKLLLEHGARGNEKMLYGQKKKTALEEAGDNLPIIRMLADAGAELNNAVMEQVLAQPGGLAVADELMEKHRPDIDIDKLMSKFLSEKDPEAVNWLLDHGAAPDVTRAASSMGKLNRMHRSEVVYTIFLDNRAPRKSIYMMPHENDYALLECFLKHGFDPSYEETDLGGNPISMLAYSLKNSRFDLAMLLLQYGAKGDITCDGLPIFYRLLDFAARPENADRQEEILKVADAMVEHGANPAQDAKNGWSPIKEYVTGKYASKTTEPMRKWMEKHL